MVLGDLAMTIKRPRHSRQSFTHLAVSHLERVDTHLILSRVQRRRVHLGRFHVTVVMFSVERMDFR